MSFSTKPPVKEFPVYTLYLDSTVFFGKYKGKTIAQILVENRGYIDWLKNETKHKIILTNNPVKKEIVDDDGWRLVSIKIMRLWASGYYLQFNRPTGRIDFSE